MARCDLEHLVSRIWVSEQAHPICEIAADGENSFAVQTYITDEIRDSALKLKAGGPGCGEARSFDDWAVVEGADDTR